MVQCILYHYLYIFLKFSQTWNQSSRTRILKNDFLILFIAFLSLLLFECIVLYDLSLKLCVTRAVRMRSLKGRWVLHALAKLKTKMTTFGGQDFTLLLWLLHLLWFLIISEHCQWCMLLLPGSTRQKKMTMLSMGIKIGLYVLHVSIGNI